jgi:type I restriction enzyme S subunit
MMDKSKTATMTTIGQKDVITGIIYVPPLELQMEFVNFAEQSDKSKFELQKALDEMTAMQKKIIEQNLT